MCDSIFAKEGFKLSIAKMFPTSLIMALGVPNSVKIFFFKKFTTTLHH